MKIDINACARYAADLMQAQGLPAGQAEAVAGKLVESDLLGHRTHGLAMLPMYLERLSDGRIARNGEISVVADHGSTFSWQAHRLPGAWVMNQAIAQAVTRIGEYPTVTFTIANCSHIGALQAYLPEVGDRKLMALMAVTDPGVVSVAPFGGISPVLTTNPIAACIPSRGDPILVDQSTSLVSNAAVGAYAAANQLLPGRWLVDNQGRPSDDPHALGTTPPGTIMPLGGEDYGYKGFGFGLMVEALALALSGYGRNSPTPCVRGAQGVYMQLIDPSKFGGLDQFLDEITALIARCKASPPAQGFDSVRLPGERALSLKRKQIKEGLEVDEGVAARIGQWAENLGVPPLGIVKKETP